MGLPFRVCHPSRLVAQLLPEPEETSHRDPPSHDIGHTPQEIIEHVPLLHAPLRFPPDILLPPSLMKGPHELSDLVQMFPLLSFFHVPKNPERDSFRPLSRRNNNGHRRDKSTDKNTHANLHQATLFFGSSTAIHANFHVQPGRVFPSMMRAWSVRRAWSASNSQACSV